tara:strand:+ start:1443 stop:1745 length:303 start_codon:yes stop_codon:yes gene_type:complete
MEEQYKKIFTEKDESEVGEKHVPVVELVGDAIKVNVGKVEHPSESGHFIQWIEILDGDISLARVYLTPFMKPEAAFTVKENPENLKVRIFCNLHGTFQYG